jgi:predicted nucleic acid-binding protein
MILIDTNALVGLVDHSDPLNRQAAADFGRLAKRDLFVISPVLTEAMHLLPGKPDRQRLVGLIDQFQIKICPIREGDQLWAEVFKWVLQYWEHSPDWADGMLAVMSGHEKKFRVWSYDREFKTIWRRPDGTRIPLAVDTR